MRATTNLPVDSTSLPAGVSWCLLVLVLPGMVTGLAAQEGGIEVFAGETLFESGVRVSLTEINRSKRGLFRGSSEVADPLGRSLDDRRSVLGLDYGFDRRITLTALVPYVDRVLKTSTTRQSASGLGDLALVGKYRLVHREGRATAFNWSLVGGLETPTGATNATDPSGPRLDPSVQVGKGSWNPFIATSATYGYQLARFDATAFYKLNTEGAQQFEDGDFFSISLSGAYRFLHFQYPGPTFGLRLGLQYRHEGRAEMSGAALGDSGADELLFTPALSIHPIPRMDLVLGASIPVYQHYQGSQLGRDVGLIFALGMRF
ncbi:MAG: hypothetical protein VX951_09975 [Planctomycetota bacterium]|nr:hypothetical protein [Planctomycetota bacterium]